ncbi:MAG TPA: cation:proton antiporter [Candidatus Nanoarchaeia archaeon]|nr:cation:proton antiporter [Candidatus Nanoarchaeia archaeon]
MIDVFVEIGLIIIVATLLAYIGRCLKQPSIIAYILAGIIIGPLGFGLIKNMSVIQLFSELGIIFLLFIVGIQLDIKKLKTVGIPAIVIGLGQIAFTSSIGFFIARIWFEYLPSLYIAIALSLSSTVVVVKLLMDKKEIETLHARIALGVLLVQDIVAIFALIFFSSIGNFSLGSFLAGSGKMVAFFVLAVAASVFVIPRVLEKVSKSVELLFLTGLSWAFGLALIAKALDFSAVIGAFVAGVTLASTPYSLELSSRLKPLRDFFVTIFFVALGMQIVAGPVSTFIVPIIVLSLVVIIGNPFIMLVITALYGYHRRTAFLTSTALAQVSEFSLVIVALGASLGHIPAQVVSIIAAVATITLGISTYFIMYSKSLYQIAQPFLRWHARRQEDLEYNAEKKADVVLCGYSRMGYSILKKVHAMKKNVLVVDYNPDVIRHLITMKVPCIYGDVSDHDVIERMQLKHAQLCVSTIATLDDNLYLLRRLQSINKKITAVFTAQDIDDANELYKKGAHYVIVPHHVSGEHFAFLLEDFNLKSFDKHRRKHLMELEKRKSFVFQSARN